MGHLTTSSSPATLVRSALLALAFSLLLATPVVGQVSNLATSGMEIGAGVALGGRRLDVESMDGEGMDWEGRTLLNEKTALVAGAMMPKAASPAAPVVKGVAPEASTALPLEKPKAETPATATAETAEAPMAAAAATGTAETAEAPMAAAAATGTTEIAEAPVAAAAATGTAGTSEGVASTPPATATSVAPPPAAPVVKAEGAVPTAAGAPHAFPIGRPPAPPKGAAATYVWEETEADSPVSMEGSGASGPVADSPSVEMGLAPSPEGNVNTDIVKWPSEVLAYPVIYLEGPVMTKPIKVHFIYYGNWTGNFGQHILPGFVNSLNSSALDGKGKPGTAHEWWNVVSSYPGLSTEGTHSRVSSIITAGQTVVINKGYKKLLSDGNNGTPDDIWRVLSSRLGKVLPEDPNAIYTFITSADVTVESAPGAGFCRGYCSWHRTTSGTKYIFLGEAGVCPCAVRAGLKATANRFPRIDSIVSNFAHELMNTVVNPDPSANKTGWCAMADTLYKYLEIGDLCLSMYTDYNQPKLSAAPDRSFVFNMRGLNGLRFLVQAVVSIDMQKCVMGGPSSSELRVVYAETKAKMEKEKEVEGMAPSPAGAGGNVLAFADLLTEKIVGALPPTASP